MSCCALLAVTFHLLGIVSAIENYEVLRMLQEDEVIIVILIVIIIVIVIVII